MKPLSNELVLKNYNLLQESGILEYIDNLKETVNDLESLLGESGEILHQESVQELAHYVAQKLLNKLVPTYLVFVFQEEAGTHVPTILAYKNLKLTDPPFQIETMEPYAHFFTLSPRALDFKVFEYMVGRPELTDIFLPTHPQKVIPILGFDGVYGFILVGKKVVGGNFSDQEMYYLDKLMSFASLSLQNNIHYRRAIIDFKTKLHNHSFFTMRLEEEMARIRRYSAQVTLLMIDVDFFKLFNDVHGHLAGDKVLFEVAQVLSSEVRREDIAARFGGEEFVILLIQSNKEYGLQVAERIRKRVANNVVQYEGKALNVTVSLGVSSCSHESLLPDSATLIQQADKALYVSKKQGRNKTTVFQ